jgi:Lysylphosphatidylglycerol synthase TM region
MRKRLGRLFAWIVTVALLGYLLSRVSLTEVVRAVKTTPGWTVPVLVATVLLIYLADSLAIWRTFAWFLARLSFGEVLVVRGATYLLAMVNYAVGQGAIVYFVNRSRGVPVARGTGAVLLVMGINVLLLLFLATLGLFFAPSVPPAITTIVVVAYAGLAVYVALLIWKPAFLTSRPVFDVLLNAGIKGHLKALAVRIPHLLSLLLYSYLALRAFGVRVPIGDAMLRLPIVYFIAVLPISVQGLGTTQMAWKLFFAQYAPGPPEVQVATIFACSLFSQAVGIGVQSLLGLACLKNQMARSLQPTPT